MRFLWGWLRRWGHGLLWMFHGHQCETYYDRNYWPIRLSCTCGKEFWVRKDLERKSDESAT